MGFINLLRDTFTSALSCSRIEQPQCEANADTEIVSPAVEHLQLNKPGLTKTGVTAKNVKKTSSTVVSHIYAYDRAKTLSFILLIRRKSTEFENESNV